jgi:hypothetical protein
MKFTPNVNLFTSFGCNRHFYGALRRIYARPSQPKQQSNSQFSCSLPPTDYVLLLDRIRQRNCAHEQCALIEIGAYAR